MEMLAKSGIRWALVPVVLVTMIAAACGGSGGTSEDDLTVILQQVLGVGQSENERLEVVIGRTVEGFPQEFPLYDGAEIVASLRSETSNSTNYLAVLTVSDPVEQVIGFYEVELDLIEPWQVIGASASREGGAVRFFNLDDPDSDGAIFVSRAALEGPTSISINISLSGSQLLQDVTPFQLAESLPLPRGFPRDLPIYPGSTVIANAWFHTSDVTTSYLTRLLTTDFEEDAIAFYRQRLEEAGWEIADDFQDAGGFGLIFVDSFDEALGGTVLADVFPEDTKYTEVILQINTASRLPR